MNKEIDHGFDLPATRIRLEAWLLEFFACPYPAPGYWAGGREAAVRHLALMHWSEHGLPTMLEDNGRLVPAPRCSTPACPVLGVSLAILELDAYEATLAETATAAELRRRSDTEDLSERQRSQLRATARCMERTPLSRAVRERTRGRPPRVLAQAVVQHLAHGGLSQSRIGKFMGTSNVDAVRKRWNVGERRSLQAFVVAAERSTTARSKLP